MSASRVPRCVALHAANVTKCLAHSFPDFDQAETHQGVFSAERQVVSRASVGSGAAVREARYSETTVMSSVCPKCCAVEAM